MSNKLAWFFYSLLAINLIYTLSGVLNFQIESVDVLGMWLFKAKAIYIEGGFPLQTLQDPDFLLAHPQYPLLLSAAYAGIYFLMGQVWELPILLLYPLYYSAILYLVYKVLRDLQLHHSQALLYVYAYSMFSPLLGQAGRGHAGSADILIVLLGWVLVRIVQTQASRPSWRSLCIGVGVVWISSQIKLEGLFQGAAVLFIKSQLDQKMTALFVAIMPFLIWNVILATLAIPSDFTFVYPGISALIWRVWLILTLTFQEMVNLRNWYLFWPLAGIAMATAKPAKSTFIESLLLTLLLVSLGYVMVYLSVTTNVEAHISSSIDRVLLHLTPWIYPIFVWYSQKHLEVLSQSSVRTRQ